MTPAESVERLGGADVGGGLLAADVLLAGLKGEHESAAAVDVYGFAGDAAGHPPQVLLAGGEEPEGGSAEVQAVAQRLTLADRDVHTALAGRGEDAERDGIDLGDDDWTPRTSLTAPPRGVCVRPGRCGGRIAGSGSACPGTLRGGAQRRGVLDGAVEVGLGEDRGAGVGVDRSAPGVEVGGAVEQRHLDDLDAVAVRVGAQRLQRVGVKPSGDHEPAAAVVELGEVSGGSERARPLVYRGVCDRQRGELADSGLVLEHHLQSALRYLRLIGGVGGEELRAVGQHVDQRGDIVVVHAGAQEGELLLRADVALRELAEVLVDVLLGQAGGQIQSAAQAHGLGDLAIEELLHGAHADRREHRGDVGLGGGGVASHHPSLAGGPDHPPSHRAARALAWCGHALRRLDAGRRTQTPIYCEGQTSRIGIGRRFKWRMKAHHSNPGGEEIRVPLPPSAPVEQPGEDLCRLGEALKARAEDVLERTVARTSGSGHDVDAVVQDSFERISRSSTIAVARWIAGEGLEVAIEAGQETWQIFGELAAHRAASLNEVTRRCFWWRDVMAEVLRESAAQLDVSPEALSAGPEHPAAEPRVQPRADVRVL